MTEITPLPTAQKPATDIYERRESNVRSYCRALPRQFASAEGVWMHDDAGGRYLDFLAGCSTLNYGHNHPLLKQALLDYIAADGVAHGLDLHTDAKAEFLHAMEDLILRPRGLDYRLMFTGPTGANAVEAAIKLARKVTGRTMVVAFSNGFHGMTLGALACTGNAAKRTGAGVPLSDVVHAPYDGYHGADVDTAELLERQLADASGGIDAPAAIIVETVQGEGGLNVASPEWLRRTEAIARRHGALFIIDDIQAGCGRTGSFFSFDGMGLHPDMVTLAKSLSGMGLPLAVTLLRPELDVWAPGEHNGTFRGNNHAFVTAAAALRHFWADDRLQQDIARRGAIMEHRLAEIAARHGLEVRGRGMMRGINLGHGDLAAQVTARCFDKGLIIETSGADGEIVKLLPPLVIADAELDMGIDIIAASVAEVLGAPAVLAAE